MSEAEIALELTRLTINLANERAGTTTSGDKRGFYYRDENDVTVKYASQQVQQQFNHFLSLVRAEKSGKASEPEV